MFPWNPTSFLRGELDFTTGQTCPTRYSQNLAQESLDLESQHFREQHYRCVIKLKIFKFCSWSKICNISLEQLFHIVFREKHYNSSMYYTYWKLDHYIKGAAASRRGEKYRWCTLSESSPPESSEIIEIYSVKELYTLCLKHTFKNICF